MFFIVNRCWRNSGVGCNGSNSTASCLQHDLNFGLALLLPLTCSSIQCHTPQCKQEWVIWSTACLTDPRRYWVLNALRSWRLGRSWWVCCLFSLTACLGVCKGAILSVDNVDACVWPDVEVAPDWSKCKNDWNISTWSYCRRLIGGDSKSSSDSNNAWWLW